MNHVSHTALARLAAALDDLEELDEAIAIERHAARRDRSLAADLAAALGVRLDLHDRIHDLIERVDQAAARIRLRAWLAEIDAAADEERKEA